MYSDLEDLAKDAATYFNEMGDKENTVPFYEKILYFQTQVKRGRGTVSMKFKALSVVFVIISVISIVGYFTSAVTASHDEARRGHTASIGYSA
ncbi:hypothetical protein SA286_06025 [Bacillus altitudinis]|nr:hypothetical protein [Bacillus altitudinis]WRO27182.1 hypothetical protein SA286_06025 [Bacillus altitudinis]